ncbi:MAG: TolC family protein [Cyclobacteriaceae bacterium]
MRLFFFFKLLFFVSFWNVNAQDSTSTVLPLEQYYCMVYQNHPIVKQATLLVQRGRLSIQEARGAFDPKLNSTFYTKDFNGKDYYDLWNTYLKVPTLLNVDLKAGFENNSGLYLNPEHSLPNQGLYYMGISVPLGQGLMRNPRNIELKKSNFHSELTRNDAQILLNNLFLDANHAYWLWYEQYHIRQLVQDNLRLIEQKYQGVRESVINGEYAAIDSVEMYIQVQQWGNELKMADMALQNCELLLRNFIWNDQIDLGQMIPETHAGKEDIDLDQVLQWAIHNHPQLQQLEIQNTILDLDRKMRKEQLKPVFNINYNLLLQNGNRDNGDNGAYANNYKGGFEFVFPLLVRKERAKLKVVTLKQQENSLKLDNKAQETFTKVEQSYNKGFTLDEMIKEQERIITNQVRMLQAEQIKFDSGESSVFLLNSRENKKLKSQIKLIELRAKYGRALGELSWSAGKLFHDVKTNNDI